MGFIDRVEWAMRKNTRSRNWAPFKSNTWYSMLLFTHTKNTSPDSFFNGKSAKDDVRLRRRRTDVPTMTTAMTTTNGRIASHAAFFERLHALGPRKTAEDDGGSGEDEDGVGIGGGGRFGRKRPSGASAAAAARKAKKLEGLRPETTTTRTKGTRKEPAGGDGSDENDESDGSDDEEDDALASSSEDVEAEATERNGDARRTTTMPVGKPKAWKLETSTEDKLEALRERLRKKIESSRSARKALETEKTAASAKEWREARNKAKREKKRKERASATLAEAKGKSAKKAKGTGDGGDAEGSGRRGGEDMAFGRVVVDDDQTNSGKKKRKESKESMLRKVQARQKAIDDAGGEEGGGKAVADKFAWEAALSRASGEKVLDDPKLLQKSIKRAERAKKKSREKWEERTAKVQEQMNAAQTKRRQNIKAKKETRMEQKLDKKAGKRNRPGFEGRSDGFINK